MKKKLKKNFFSFSYSLLGICLLFFSGFSNEGMSIGKINLFKFNSAPLSAFSPIAGVPVTGFNSKNILNRLDSQYSVSCKRKRSAVSGRAYSTARSGLIATTFPNTDLTNRTVHDYLTTEGENRSSTGVNTRPQAPTRIICIGNSITAGSGVADPATESYPAQLGTLLGSGFTVLNFGSSARTMLKNGDYPFWNTGGFTNALRSIPDIVIIKLGTNDSKAWNWVPYGAEYAADYKSMIDTFRSLPSHPKIFICLPAKVFGTAYGIDEVVLANEIRPAVVQVGKGKGVNVIDIYDTTKNAAADFPDGVHPDVTGAAIIAAKVERLITYNVPAITRTGNVLQGPVANAYQWYLNGDTITAANGGANRSLTIVGPGNYSLSVKLNAYNEDRVVTDILVADSTGFSPAAPESLITGVGNTTITLHWIASAGADSYNIKRSTVSGGPYNLILSGVTATSFIDTGLVNGTMYYYVVTSTNANGESSNSMEAGAIPTPAAGNNYSFIGNGNWDDSANWYNNAMPPAILPPGAQIIIDPVEGGECFLNISYTLSSGATLVIMGGKKFIIAGSLILIQ